jgi:hypothetical protein
VLLGRSLRAKSQVLIPSDHSPEPARSPGPLSKRQQCPHLFSIPTLSSLSLFLPVTTCTDRDPSLQSFRCTLLSLAPLNSITFPSIFSIPFLSLFSLFIVCSRVPESLGAFFPFLIWLFPPAFPVFSTRTLTYMRLFTPRCFNHPIPFPFLGTFFLIPPDQTGEVFISPPYPLICAAMHPAFP